MTTLKNSELKALIEKCCPNIIDRYALKRHMCDGITWHVIIYDLFGDMHPKREEKYRRRFQKMAEKVMITAESEGYIWE